MTDEIVKREPVPVADSFAGMCLSRSTSVQLYFTRIVQYLVGNAAGLTYVASILEDNKTEHSPLYLLSIILLAFWSNELNSFGYILIKESSDHSKLWTKKLIQIEKYNGVQGEIAMFSSLDYLALTVSKKSSTLDYLRHYLFYSRICWTVLGLVALYQLVTHKEISQWIAILRSLI